MLRYSAARVRTLGRRGVGSLADRLRINASRINEDLRTSCQWGATPDGGMNRLTLTQDDAHVRAWFTHTTLSLGCTLTTDALGNTFATLPGLSPSLPPIAMGSHLDTQPAGGRYDGLVGVHAGIEVLKTIKEAGVRTHAPIAVVNWTNEEGARFAPAMLGSGVWAGAFQPAFAYSRTDSAGVTLLDALDAINARGSTPASYKSTPLSAHFEVHIEQGPILESLEQPVGVVTGVQAISWHTLTLTSPPGPSHTGTTPLTARHDALLCFAELVQLVRATAEETNALASVCVVKAEPQSVNTLVSRVEFSLDTRASSDAALSHLEETLKTRCTALARARGVALNWDTYWRADATVFDEAAVACVRAAAGGAPELVSGAGHDSVYTARRCPTAMIFVRCRGGVSHHPSEFASPEDIARGAEVLLGSVLAFDEGLRTKANT